MLHSLKSIGQAPQHGQVYKPDSLDEFEAKRRLWKAFSKKFVQASNQLRAAEGEGYPEDALSVLKAIAGDYGRLRDLYAQEMGEMWAEVYPGLDKIILPKLKGIGRGLLSQMFGLVDYSQSVGGIRNYIGIAPVIDGHWPKRKKGQKCKHIMEGKALAVKKVGTQVRKANAVSRDRPTKVYELLEARKQYDIEAKGFSKEQAEFEASAYVSAQLLIKLVKCCLDGKPFVQPEWKGCPNMYWCQEIVEEYQNWRGDRLPSLIPG